LIAEGGANEGGRALRAVLTVVVSLVAARAFAEGRFCFEVPLGCNDDAMEALKLPE